MLPYRDSTITRIALGLFFIIVIFYAYFEAQGILYGPKISVPAETIETTERYITLKGRAERISELRMNGQPIAVTEEGYFEEPYLLAPGLNTIIFDAEDKYGHKKQEVVHILYTPSSDPTSPSPLSATTTLSTDQVY